MGTKTKLPAGEREREREAIFIMLVMIKTTFGGCWRAFCNVIFGHELCLYNNISFLSLSKNKIINNKKNMDGLVLFIFYFHVIHFYFTNIWLTLETISQQV